MKYTYCNNCNKLELNEANEFNCIHPSNINNWYSADKNDRNKIAPELIYNRKPCDINKKNNCYWFENK